MDIHNENHMAERQNELDDGQGEEIVEEYRENYHEENYSNNPKLIAVPSLTSESLLSSHHTLQTDDTILHSPHIQPADDMNLLRDTTENTLKKSSYVDFFPNKSPCCSKTCYDLMCDHRPSTSKGFSPSDNLDIERKKTGHCLETLHNIEEIYSFESGYVERASTNSNHSLLSNDSSKCELAQVSLESCLTIIGSHLHSCFSRSTSVHWDNSHVNLESEPESILNLDIRDEVPDCSSEEIIAGQVSKSNLSCEGSMCKPSSTHTADGKLVASKTRVSPGSSSPPLVDHYSAEDQLILPNWIVRIMTETTDTPFHSVPVYEEQEGMTASAPMERQAGGDGVCIHSYPSSHSSGHASMSSTTSHTNQFQSIMVPVERQAYSFMDIPYYRPAFRDSYQSSSSNSSIDLQLPVEVQDAVVGACQCEYCLANNSDSASHRNYMYDTQDHNLATLRPKHNTADAQDSSDDTYQSHTYLNTQTITFALNCSNENCFGKEPQKNLNEEIQQRKSPTDFKDDSEYRLIERTHQYEEPPPLNSSEYFRMSILHEINLHGVSSDMSGNYADIETDLDSEPD